MLFLTCHTPQDDRSIHSSRCRLACYPRPSGPLLQRWAEFPEIIQVAGIAVGIKTVSSKEPQISFTIGPTNSLLAAAWSIARSRCSQGPIYARMARSGCAASGNSCPFADRRVVFPKVIQILGVSCRIESCATKYPEIALLVFPTDRLRSTAGNTSIA